MGKAVEEMEKPLAEDDIQIKSSVDPYGARIGVCRYPDGGRKVMLGRALKSSDEIDEYVDDLIRQLNHARENTKAGLKKYITN